MSGDSSGDRVRLTVAAAERLARDVLAGQGYADEEAGIIADHVVDAAVCGYEYAGLPKLLNVAEHASRRGTRAPIRVVHETAVSARLDGGGNVGMLAVARATTLVLDKARAAGFGLVGVHNTWMSGRSAHYVERIARAGCIGIHTVSSRPQVAPPGARQAALGTNPIAFGFPAEGDPLVIDLGTSAFMFTDLMFRARRGEILPEGVAIDADGHPTRDPSRALHGAVLPFGGHKGFALSLAMAALGALAGAGEDPDHAGYLLIAMQPDLLLPAEAYRRELGELRQRIKATPRQPGVAEIRLPSERAQRSRVAALRDGITIDRSVHDALQALTRRITQA